MGSSKYSGPLPTSRRVVLEGAEMASFDPQISRVYADYYWGTASLNLRKSVDQIPCLASSSSPSLEPLRISPKPPGNSLELPASPWQPPARSPHVPATAGTSQRDASRFQRGRRDFYRARWNLARARAKPQAARRTSQHTAPRGSGDASGLPPGPVASTPAFFFTTPHRRLTQPKPKYYAKTILHA